MPIGNGSDLGSRLTIIAIATRSASPTRRQLEQLAAYAAAGSGNAAAQATGVALSTLKNELSTLYRTLGVRNALQASCALGWLRIPAEPNGDDTGEELRSGGPRRSTPGGHHPSLPSRGLVDRHRRGLLHSLRLPSAAAGMPARLGALAGVPAVASAASRAQRQLRDHRMIRLDRVRDNGAMPRMPFTPTFFGKPILIDYGPGIPQPADHPRPNCAG